MIGFGAGLPHSSAYNLAMLKKRNETAYWALMTKLFRPTDVD